MAFNAADLDEQSNRKAAGSHLLQLMQELMSVSSVDVVGPFPADLQVNVILMGGVFAPATDQSRAEAFLAFLKKLHAAAVVRYNGLEPA